MDNPFISKSRDGGEYLTSKCSMNKVRIARVPVAGIEDEIEGKCAGDIFSAKLIIDEIKNNADKLQLDLSKISEIDLPRYLSNIIFDEDVQSVQYKCAIQIGRKFGRRFGLILLTLKTGLEENKLAREDWNNDNWKYWKNVSNIILAGGLASGELGKIIAKSAKEVFDAAGVEPYNLILSKNSSQIGLLGCMTRINNDCNLHILFDFGQTKIKRTVAVKCNEATTFIELDSKKSLYMDWQNEAYEERIINASKLHQYLLEIIVDTYNYVKDKYCSEYGDIGNKIIISIANYIIDGKINPLRSGYSKLSELENYQKGYNYSHILADALKDNLKQNIEIEFIHDATAAALYFSDYENSVCITMGTAFGVGFPEIKLKI